MARTLRLFGIVALSATTCLYLVYRLLFSATDSAVSLIQYPSPEDIKAAVLSNAQNSTFVPPLRTRGRYVIDANNDRFKLASVNWYGASDELFVVGGLDVRHRDDIAQTIKALGFNSVRLPYSDQMVRDNPEIPATLLTANADLMGYSALEIFAAVVTALTDVGLAVIINNHITTARWCCDANLCDGLWYNSHLGPFCPVPQTQEDWISHLETVMIPHINNPYVVGVDLRNEIRGIKDRFLWKDWASAAEEAAERLHILQPEWLMFVEGVSSANVVTGARKRPIELSNPDKVVYSAHVYGWSGWGTLRPYWNRNYDSFSKDMYSHWEFLIDEDIAPVWVGEFGAPGSPNNGDMRYWRHLMRYLAEADVDWGYWALNPRKPRDNEVEGYGLLEDDWKTVRWDYRLYDLAVLTEPKGSL